jgi:hypothetical protein
MDLIHALHIFRLYCYHLKRNPSDAESLLLTDSEKEAIRQLKGLIMEYSDLILQDQPPAKA